MPLATTVSLNGNDGPCPSTAIASAAQQPRGRVGSGQTFRIPEGKSEVSYLSQFHLLNATGRVWLNPEQTA